MEEQWFALTELNTFTEYKLDYTAHDHLWL